MPRPSDIRGRGAQPLILAACVVGACVVLFSVGRDARAESERLVLGTHDAALAAALSVAVSPRGLSVFELPEPLDDVTDVPSARHEISVPGTVAVVWLCDDERGAHSLCFCAVDGRLVVKPLSVSTPLSPPDAAAVALSVKMLLGAPPPPKVTAPPPERIPALAPRAAAPRPAAPPPPTLPALVVELDAGERLQPLAAGHLGFRAALKGVFAPAALARRVGVGASLAGGQALAAAGLAPGRTLDDLTFGAFARGRLPQGPVWLELDLGPSVHLLSAHSGPGASDGANLSLDGLVGAVMPLGRMFFGVRAGGFYVLTSPTTTSATGSSPLQLPRWNGELMLALGVATR